MPLIEQNGPDFKYVITYWRIDNPGQLFTTTIQQPEAWHYVVQQTNLGIYKEYGITVKAANSRGDSSANLPEVRGFTGEDGNDHFY